MDKNIFRNMSYGVYITTTVDEGRPVGCISNSNTQITSSPATFSVSLNHDNYTTECIRRCRMFAFTILSEQSDPALIGRFGFASSRDTDKFEGLDVDIFQCMPAVKTGCGYVVCRVIGEMETSTHTIFLGQAVEAKVLSNEAPMTYKYYHEVIRGKSPKSAPTYIAEEKKPEEKTAKSEESGQEKHRYVCNVCGYVYEGESLPEDYICPLCKHGAQDFTQEA